MQHVSRLILALILIVMLCPAAWAKPGATQAEYKRSDTNYYWKGDVLKVDPNAVILTAGTYTQKGDSYFMAGAKKAPKEVYIQVVNDWIEPITPPDMPASLGVAPDAMQIREPQGDVQVALPSAPTSFAPATDRMVIPNGTVVKTGDNATAAVLFGGVDSARLTPNSEAAVQQTVGVSDRSTEVDLTKGAVFSKVGHREGVKEDYKVKTPFGVAAARGTDFVSVALPARTDVWIAQGTVQLDSPDGKTVGTVKSEGTGALKIIRFPVMTDLRQAMMASSETMTTAMNFIPLANQKLKALHDKVSEGIKLTPNEQAYISKIKKVPCLIKLELVPPPAPPAPAPLPAPAATPAPAPEPALTPHMSTPSVAPLPVPGASNAPATTAKPVVTNVDVRTDGKVRYQGGVLSLDELKPKLQDFAKNTPDQTLTIRAGKLVKYEQIKAVVDLCSSVPIKNLNLAIKDKDTAAKIAVANSAPAATSPPAATASTPAVVPTPAPTTPAAPATAATTPAAPAPVTLHVHADGTVDLKKGTPALTLDQLKPKLEDLAKSTPVPAVVIRAGKAVPYDQVKKVIDLCASENIPKVIDMSANGKIPAPASTASQPGSNGESLMQPSMASASNNAPPVPPTAPKPKKVKPAPAVSEPLPAPSDNTPAVTIP